MQIAHFRSHVIPLRNVLLFKYLHMKKSTPKSTITWSEVGTTNNQGKEVYCRIDPLRVPAILRCSLITDSFAQA